MEMFDGNHFTTEEEIEVKFIISQMEFIEQCDQEFTERMNIINQNLS